MKRIEDVMSLKSHLLLMFFRVVMVGIVLMLELGLEIFEEGVRVSELTVLFVAGIYLLGTLLMGISRSVLYLEPVLIVVGVMIIGDNFLALFIFPVLVAILYPKTSFWEFFFIPIMISSVIFYKFGFNEIGVIVMISVFLLMYLKGKEGKLKNIELKNSKLESHKLRKELGEVEREKIQTEIDLENLMNMFVRIKNLNEKIKVEDLLQEMIQGSRDFFQAEQVGMYMLEGENYVLKKKYDKKVKLPLEIDAIDAEDIIIEERYMRVPINKNKEKWCLLLIVGKKQALINDAENGVRYVPARFEEDDYEQLRMFLQQVMTSINYAELLGRMENMANKDYLTNIPNRRRFVEEAEVLIERAKRGADLAMVLLDIDFFKKFNDTYGHDKGDEALKVVANVLDEFVRGSDFVGRLGGEEFGILMPNDNEAVLKAAERLRIKISEVPFITQITVSMGVAFYKEGMGFDELNKMSDKALYKAKEAGRNRVVLYEE